MDENVPDDEEVISIAYFLEVRPEPALNRFDRFEMTRLG
jgi:hypothetical protein